MGTSAPEWSSLHAAGEPSWGRGAFGGRAVRMGYALSAGSAGLLVLLCVMAWLGISPAWEWIPGGGGVGEGGGVGGVTVRLRPDALGTVFGVMVTGIGSLVLAYAGHYMKDEARSGRFLVTLAGFLVAMLGLVLADDLLAVFLFWELTSVTSFLLIGQTRTEQARRGALQALLVTGLGGVCLLAGGVLIRHVAGTSSLSELAAVGTLVRASPMYPVIVVLLGVGCLSKSAQFPLHFWLPDSMAAPTPASAFLHSATMVKAGIYLLLRLEPALGGTTLWTSTLMGCGGVTMLLGAYQGMRQNDLKALLAYSTLSQLGALTLLLGVGGGAARAAVVVGVVAHAAYKSALFLTAGAVDHAAGTRELSRLGGLGKVMPVTAALSGAAALSMAGVMPLAGFVAKEKFLAVGELVRGEWAILAIGGLVGAMLVVQAGRLWCGTFLGRRVKAGAAEGEGHLHDPQLQDPHLRDPHWAMLVAIGVPAVAGVVLPWVGTLGPVLTRAAEPGAWVRGASAQVVHVAGAGAERTEDGHGAADAGMFPFHGVNTELMVSVAALLVGAGLYAGRGAVLRGQDLLHTGPLARRAFDGAVRVMEAAAWAVTRLQNGDVRLYLCVMVVATGWLVVNLGPVPIPTRWPSVMGDRHGLASDAAVALLRAFTLMLAVVSCLGSVLIRRDLFAVLSLGASGVAMALLFALEPAPDVALVMIVVDLATVVLLVMALGRLPAARRAKVEAQDVVSPWRYTHVMVAGVAGLIATLVSLQMLETRPRESRVTPFYEAAAKPLVGSDDIVGAIVIDFRGFDTLIEITVFGMGGLGVYGVLRYAARTAGDRPEAGRGAAPVLPAGLRGVGGGGVGESETSPLLRGLAQVLLPLCLVIAATHIMFGHHGPGDGFTAGVIASLGVSFKFVMLGHEQVRRTLRWLRPTLFIGAGVLLVVVAQWVSGLWGGSGTFFAPMDFGTALGVGWLLPEGFALSSSLAFEVAIFLSVLGAASHMIDTLGHPTDYDDVLAETDAVPFSLEEHNPIIAYRYETIDTDEDVTPLARGAAGAGRREAGPGIRQEVER